MNISVIGTGYVGLVTGTCLAETGNNVLCIDIDNNKVEKMQQGIVPIYEPHLDSLFERNINAGRLKFSTSLEKGLEHGDIIFLAFVHATFSSFVSSPPDPIVSGFVLGC